MKRTTAILAGLLAIVLAGPARAADAPPDPADLLRRARTTESADRDIPRAIDLYEAALLASKDEASAGVARDAALRLLHLREARGEREEALKMAVLLWTDLAARLTPEQVPLVRAALGRLLAAGRSVTGPHGTIYVDDPRVVAGGLSPLEATIVDQLRSLKGLDGDRRAQRQGQIREALVGVGRDALPALEKAIRREGPDIAPFAAELYAELGGVEAFPLLEDLLRGADPFARAAAADAIDDVRHAEEDREAYVAGLSRVLDLPALASRRESLRDRIRGELTMEETYERAKAGGPDADWWLGRAIEGGHRPAIEQAIGQARQGGQLPEDLVASLESQYGVRNRVYSGDQVTMALARDDLAFEDRLLVLDLLAAQPPSESSASAIASVAAACTKDRAGPAAEKAAEAAWRHALAIADPSLRAPAVRHLAMVGVGVPPAVVRDSGEVYAQVLARGEGPTRRYGFAVRAMFGEPLMAEPAFWRALASAIGSTKSDVTVAHLVASVNIVLRGNLGGKASTNGPPPEHDALWVPLLDRVSSQEDFWKSTAADWLITGAARSGDPRVLEWVRRQRRPNVDAAPWFVGSVARSYRGPGRRELALDGLTDTAFYSPALVRTEASQPEFWSAFFERAARYDGPQLVRALGALNDSCLRSVQVANPPARPGLGAWKGDEELAGLFAAAARPEWVVLLRRPDVDASTWPTAAMARLAAASGSPDFLALVRERATAPDAAQPQSRGWLLASHLGQALPFFAEDLPVAWLEGLLEDRGLPRDHMGLPFSLLRTDPSPEAKAAIVRLAKTPTSPAADMALFALTSADRGPVLEIVAAAATAQTADWPQRYRAALVRKCATLKLREAIPFLLTQYQGDLEADAANALDGIRAYHERLATFQSWAKDVAEGRRDLSKLLADPDPEIRRAAVLSLGALADRDALPALVRIAKEEKDGKVRAAALEAVERIARSPAPARAPAPVPKAE